MVASFDPLAIAEEHRRLAAIVLVRDADTAVDAYRDHLQLLVAGAYPDADPHGTAALEAAEVPAAEPRRCGPDLLTSQGVFCR